jgi:hypothetical protein
MCIAGDRKSFFSDLQKALDIDIIFDRNPSVHNRAAGAPHLMTVATDEAKAIIAEGSSSNAAGISP